MTDIMGLCMIVMFDGEHGNCEEFGIGREARLEIRGYQCKLNIAHRSV